MVRSGVTSAQQNANPVSDKQICTPNFNNNSSDNNWRKEGAHLLHWFRSKGLRFHDQPSLYETVVAIEEAQKTLQPNNATYNTWRCVYLLDPWFACSCCSVNKWQFLLQSLEDLDNSLRKMNSRLFVIRGQPSHIFPQLLQEWSITHLTFELDPEPFAVQRDDAVMRLCSDLGIKVNSCPSHTLWNVTEIWNKWQFKSGVDTPLTFAAFQRFIASPEVPDPPKPWPVVDAKLMKAFKTPLSDEHDCKYGVPDLTDLGPFSSTAAGPCYKWPGGETEALARLERHLQHMAWVNAFGRAKLTPNSLINGSQTGLSPYLRFGCLSARLFYHRLSDLYRRVKRSPPPQSLHGQLLWRDFFYVAANNNPNFDQMENNKICLQIKWDKDPAALAKWAQGRTGFPWIDAIQTQLRQEGWIHPVARHATVCFLTRGALWISWEEGMKVFDELLLDADWTINAGTWMWMSCSAFFQSVFQLYCPVNYGRKVDPHGDYIRKYVTALKSFPSQYIHEPWKAPLSVQRKHQCVLGETYPLPMIDHSKALRRNLDRLRRILAPFTRSFQVDMPPEIPSVDQNDQNTQNK